MLGHRLLPRIRSRRALLAAILAVQAVVMAAGMVFTFVQSRSVTARGLEQLILKSNADFAERFSWELQRLGGEKLEYGSEAWQRVQDRVEQIEMPGGGFVCLLDEGGHILCHPDLRRNPALRGINMADKLVTMSDGSTVRFGDSSRAEAVAGRTSFRLDGTHYVVTAYLPELRSRLVVHQPESGLASLGTAATRPIVLGGVVRIVLVLALTAGCSMLFIRRYEHSLEAMNRDLGREVDRRTAHGLATRNALIFGLAKLADYRDSDTGLHLERIRAYSRVLAGRLRGRFPEIDDAWISNLEIASSMHDIGKVGLPDEILLKPGRLTPEERRRMQSHPIIGADTLIAVRKRMGGDDLLDMSIQVALQHHERWDGGGYPLGLAGEEIALGARVVALADFYDAVTSRRVYKAPVPHDECVRMIVEERGAHFDPAVVDAFVESADAFVEIRRAMNREEDEREGELPLPRAA